MRVFAIVSCCVLTSCGRIGFAPREDAYVCSGGAAIPVNRKDAWSPGTIAGSSAGNPTAPIGQPVWSYESIGGGPLDAADAWYRGQGTLLQWDADWFSQGRGVWASGDNVLPLVDQIEVTEAFGFTNAGLVRMSNVLSSRIDVRMSGSLLILWRGFDMIGQPAAPPFAVEAVIAHVDTNGIPIEMPLAMPVPKPTPDTTHETATVVIPDRHVIVAPGESIVLSVRPTQIDNGNSWLTIRDDAVVFDMMPCDP